MVSVSLTLVESGTRPKLATPHSLCFEYGVSSSLLGLDPSVDFLPQGNCHRAARMSSLVQANPRLNGPWDSVARLRFVNYSLIVILGIQATGDYLNSATSIQPE